MPNISGSANTPDRHLLSNTFGKPIAVALTIAWFLGIFSMYNDVQANSAHRTKAEIEQYSQKELLVQLNNNLLIMQQDVKYLRKEVDLLAESQKSIAQEVNEAKMLQVQPWRYQSTKD